MRRSVSHCVKQVGVLAVAVLLASCSGDRFSDLEAFVEETNARPARPIEPLPEFKPYESFKYSAAGLRSPFSKPVEVKLISYQKEKGRDNIKPDPNRPKEYLEGFSIDALRMVGTITLQANDSLWALVDDASGGVHRVKPGNYIGRNHGRILEVSAGQLDVIEIVPDGHGGWLERPRTLKLRDDI